MTALLVVLALEAQAGSIADVSALAVSTPQLVCRLDMNVLGGDVRFLQRDGRRGYRVMITTVSRPSS